MKYDLDNQEPGVRECSYCHFTMERLRDSRTLDANEGFLLDSGVSWDPDDHVASSLLIGDIRRYLWRHFLQPIFLKWRGNWRSFRYRRILNSYPNSLICPHCGTILKRK